MAQRRAADTTTISYAASTTTTSARARLAIRDRRAPGGGRHPHAGGHAPPRRGGRLPKRCRRPARALVQAQHTGPLVPSVLTARPLRRPARCAAAALDL